MMWDLLVNEDEAMIAQSVRDYLSNELPIERLRPHAAVRDDAQIRQGMYDLGWFGVGLPEEVGGAGLGLVEEMLVQRECGRYLVSPVEIATVLAAHVAYHGGDAALVGELITGKARAAFAFQAAPGTQSGPLPVYVVDRNEGDLALFWNDQGMGLFDASALSGLAADSCIDESLRMDAGTLDLGQPRLWVDFSKAPLRQRAQVLLSAALIGLAEHACDLTVEYAKVREQFGKPIGTFQAVKHRCADMGLRWRLAWYQTNLACLKVQNGAVDAELNSAAAKLLAGQAAQENGRASIQMHGGIGFQVECDVHWFMKRAHVYDQLGGAVRAQARRVIAEPAPAI